MGREKTRHHLAIRKAFNPKKKKDTPHHKQHRFESFSHRVSRLKIDPIRRDRGRHDEGDLEALESHFRIALDRWRDLNLSEDFTVFARKIDALCDSLPQVLHHQDRIVELLLEYIEKSTAVSAEPLLDLVAHLAQDLQAQFETHFERVVRSVAAVAAGQKEVEVVEWCFNCLTWMFKYLERVLAGDICPLYDLLAPYLGKERQKPFVSRFAAESLSFLVKRVGKRKDATRAFVKHAICDLEEMAKEKDIELYEHSLVALFVETIKSVKDSLHSTGPTIFAALLDQVLVMPRSDDATDSSIRLLRNVFLQLVHHASAENLTPLLEIVLATTNSSESLIDDKHIILKSQLLLSAVSVLGGRRVAIWPAILKYLASQIDILTTSDPALHNDTAVEVLATLAIAHQKCPLDAALASLSTLDKLCSEAWQAFFPGFCNLYAENGADRFRSFLLPRLQKFMTSHWDQQTKPLSVLVPKLVREGAVTPRAFRLTSNIQDDICARFDDLINPNPSLTSADAAEYDGYLALFDSATVDTEASHAINANLWSALMKWLPSPQAGPARAVVLGAGFLHLGNTGRAEITRMDVDMLVGMLDAMAYSLGDFPACLKGVAALLKNCGGELDVEKLRAMRLFGDMLMRCVSSRSHEIRLAALEILDCMIPSENGDWKAEMANAIEVESTEPSLETARYISMKISNMGRQYKSYSSECGILAQAVPRWLFGLLHVRFAQVWEDACAALGDIGETEEGGEVICDIAFRWLSEAPLRDETRVVEAERAAVVQDDYFSALRSKVQNSITFADRADEILLRQFEERHQRVPSLTPVNRTQALKVLKAVPRLAEKKSRQLVPVLLSWSGDTGVDEIEAQSGSDESSTLQHSFDENVRWPRKDQKALLGLFAAFGNPKVLYKAEEVYATLLSLAGHGDAEIQKSALQAILAWKDKTLKKYSDELFKFLDDARLREQLTIFLDSDESDNALSVEDRPTVMPIVLRLVYGRIIARSRNERGSNRKAVFVILSKFSEEEINVFLNVMLAPMMVERDVGNVHGKRQMGVLNMIKDLLEVCKTGAGVYVRRLAPVVFTCLLGATLDEGKVTALIKAVRQIALQCLNLCFEAGEGFEWEADMPALFERVIQPRLDRFAEENAQGVSSLLRMLGIWAKSPQLVRHLFEHERLLLPKTVDCISLPFAKEQVKRFVVNDIIRPLITRADGDDAVGQVVSQMSRHVLEQIAVLLPQSSSRELTEDAISTITALIPYTTSCPPSLFSGAAKLVQQSIKKVPHHSKRDLLSIISHFFSSALEDAEAQKDVFSAVCASFAYFSDAKSRSMLVDIAKKFAEHDEELKEVIALLDDINAFESARLGVPDFNRRSRAFGVITEQRWTGFSAKQWRLLLGNLLFYIKDQDELAIRASASHALRRFVEASASKEGDEKVETASMMQQLLSSIESGLKEQPELVAIEYLNILAEAARLPQNSSLVYDLRHLLMGGDEEASFFTNVLHVQQHRRVRAMNRLVNVASEGVLSSRNLYHLLFPLLESFIFKSGDGVLSAEATKTIGSLVEWLDWQQCRQLVRKYVGFVKSKDDMQETVLKLVDAVTSGFCRSATLRAEARVKQQESAAEDNEAMEEIPVATTKLSKTIPGAEKLSQYIIEDVLPPLSVFLREKDESFVSRRISVALIAAKFVQLLPEQDFQIRFPPLLTDVCNILRSKDQGSRDATRRALSSMCALIGPSSFGFVLRELRSALQRGFYLHVLSFSVHSILESTIASFQPGDLDYCVDDIMDVVIEDVFGNTGNEKDLQEYRADKQTKKEVKGKKSFDTMQLLASVTSLGHLVRLIRPIQSLLAGRLSIKEVRYVEELLRRVELGVLQNASLKNRDILVFCYEIIQEAHKVAPPFEKKGGKKSSAGLVESAYLIQAPKKVAQAALHKSEASGKIMRFAIDIVRSVLKKNKELLTPANISGFMPIIGDALLNPNEEVKLAAIRLFTSIINVPLPRIDDDAPVYITEAAKIIEDGQNNGGELEQASLKLISAVLRERKSAPVKVKAKTISILLKRMKGDLQIISQQGAAFNLLRSIISRQIVVPELYEIMDGDDGVAAISVRDHDRTTRDLARGVYFQFLMDCPQGKGRWAIQLAFLRGNLEYEYAEGRKSVMDTVHLLLAKVGEDIVGDVVKEVFWPLVSVMVNDADAECREMAARLVKQVFKRANAEWTETFLGLSEKLLGQGNAVQKRTALQCWVLYLEVRENKAEGLDFILESLKDVLAPQDFDAEQWQLAYWALHTFAAIANHGEEEAFAKNAMHIWINARRHLNFPHLWVKQEAVNLFGMLLMRIVASGVQLDVLPLTGPGMIKLSAGEICDLTSRHQRLLKHGVTTELAAQVVRNLAFFGRLFASNGMNWQADASNGSPALKDLGEAGDEFHGFSGDEQDDEEDSDDSSAKQTALAYLLVQLGAIIRREPGKALTPGPRQADTLIPKAAALQLLTALTNTLPEDTLNEVADIILAPLAHLTSPDLSITSHSTADFKTAHEEILRNATELQDTLRDKLGTTAFVHALQLVKNAQRERREERRAKRKVEAVARPDLVARKKAKRIERLKDKRTVKNAMERGKRRGW
jgi:U3 small nucleolar RNA-associated protein 20